MEEKYKAILVGAEYPLNNVEDLSVGECMLLGAVVAEMTKAIIAERDEYKFRYESVSK